VGLESSVSLIVASLDLRLVRLVRSAMNHGNGPHGPISPDRLIGPSRDVAPRQRVEPEPVIEPRPRVRPEPVFEPRQVFRASDPASISAADECVVVVNAEGTGQTSSGSPIEPPWKVLPWENPAPERPVRPVQRVKVVIGRPDITNKGSVIDLFI
jgi:hypothetical protein